MRSYLITFYLLTSLVCNFTVQPRKGSQQNHNNIIIWGEPQIHEKPEAVYIYKYCYLYIYLCACVILHSKDIMRMLNHHVLECDR